MTKIQLSQAQGQLFSAVTAGGEKALLRLTDSEGAVGELARKTLEELTKPGAKLSALESVNLIIQSKF